MVATFERFLNEMFAEHLEKLTQDPPAVRFEDLPPKLRLNSVFKSLQRATSGPRYGEPGRKEDRLPEIQRVAELIVTGLIDPTSLNDTGSNPSSKTVKTLFSDIGVQDVFSAVRPAFDAVWPRTETQDFLADKLDEIVNSRHRVAHRADALSISRVQLAEWPRFLRALSQVLDAQLDAYIANVVAGTAPRASSGSTT
jgi:hypothetical protein